MRETMTAFLVSYYRGMSQEDAQEILSELRDTRSLQSLTMSRAARAADGGPAHDL
jgi:hypothetical protein